MRARDPLPRRQALLASAVLQGETIRAPTGLSANYLLSVPREPGAGVPRNLHCSHLQCQTYRLKEKWTLRGVDYAAGERRAS